MKEFSKEWLQACAWFTTGRTIGWTCPRCGTSVQEFQKCTAAIDDPCPGFQRIEAANKEFAVNWRAWVKR